MGQAGQMALQQKMQAAQHPTASAANTAVQNASTLQALMPHQAPGSPMAPGSGQMAGKGSLPAHAPQLPPQMPPGQMPQQMPQAQQQPAQMSAGQPMARPLMTPQVPAAWMGAPNPNGQPQMQVPQRPMMGAPNGAAPTIATRPVMR